MARVVSFLIWMCSVGVFITSCGCVQFPFHFADARGNYSINQRSGSSTGRVVKLEKGESVSLDFCLRKQTTVFVKHVHFSNDGIRDECFLYLDDFLVSTFSTREVSEWGQMWNVFGNVSVNKGLELPRGWHVLKLKVMSGDAVEVDKVDIEFSDDRISKDVLDCSLMCQANDPRVETDDYFLPQSGVVSQTSYPTQCAEEDNVKIPIVLLGVQEYSVRATLPTYRTFENRRDENTTHCHFLPHVYWRFRDVRLPSDAKVKQSNNARLTLLNIKILPQWSKTVTVTFSLQGRSEGHIDADIGAILKILIQPQNKPVQMKVIVFGRSNTDLVLPSVIFYPGQRLRNVTIPDFTWSEKTDNIVTLTFNTHGAKSLVIEEVQMERRPMKDEESETIFRNERIVVEIVRVDFWWRAPESMSVTIKPNEGKNGHTHKDVAYFRISRPVPWTKKSFAEIFVMYQDGNVRLLQLPPSGLDWIPFGSSVIIGATNPYDHRPSAPITSVVIDPANLYMAVTYNDGSSADVRLISSIEETKIIVTNLRFTQDMTHNPFATLRSMYVEDGNSDCDSLLVDGDQSYHIMDRWLPKHGKSFLFFRRCESKHLTLSPDILLTVLRTKYGTVSHWWAPFVNWRQNPERSNYQFHKF